MGTSRWTAALALIAAIVLVVVAALSTQWGGWVPPVNQPGNVGMTDDPGQTMANSQARKDTRSEGGSKRNGVDLTQTPSGVDEKNSPPGEIEPPIRHDANDIAKELDWYLSAPEDEIDASRLGELGRRICAEQQYGNFVVVAYVSGAYQTEPQQTRLWGISILGVVSVETIRYLFNVALDPETPEGQRSRAIYMLGEAKLGSAELVSEYLKGVQRVAALDYPPEAKAVVNACILRLARDRRVGHGDPGYDAATEAADTLFHEVARMMEDDASESEQAYRLASTRKEARAILEPYQQRTLIRLALACSAYGRTGEARADRADKLRKFLSTFLAPSAVHNEGVTPPIPGVMIRGVALDRRAYPRVGTEPGNLIVHAVVAACSNQTADPLIEYIEKERSGWASFAEKRLKQSQEEAREYAKGMKLSLFDVLEWPRDQALILALSEKTELLHDDELKSMVQAYRSGIANSRHLEQRRVLSEFSDSVHEFVLRCRGFGPIPETA